MVDRPEALQRQFVDEFLNEGAPIEYRDRPGGGKWAPIDQLHILARVKSWVIPLLEERMAVWMKDRETHSRVIETVANVIEETGNQAAFDAIVRLFGDTAEAEKRISFTLNMAYATPGYISLWYHALDSENEMVRRVATKALAFNVRTYLKMEDSNSVYRFENWAEAAVTRYNRIPTMEDLHNDPILELIRSNNPQGHFEARRRLLESAGNEMEKRRKGAKPGHPR